MKTFLTLSFVVLTSFSAPVMSQSFKNSNYQNYEQEQEKLTQVAMAKIKPEHVEDFKRIVNGLLSKMRAQPGNISYNYSQNQEDPTEFIFNEHWINGVSIKNHMESAMVQNFFGQVGSFFEEGFPQLIIMKDQGSHEN